MSDPSRLTALDASRAIAAGRLSPVELMEACLARAAAREATVHAFVHLDPAKALRNAARARPGRLHGLPLAVKDVIETGDMPTGNGSPIWAGNRPRGDAACVAAAKAAGAVVMGKTVTTEFATRHPGATTNPHNPAHTPGGSSSGSAAAVADFMAPLAFGTQTAGSVIRPAAYCGVVGFKPSYMTLHRGGMKVISESLDTIGVFGRSVADCALAIAAMTGREADPEATLDRPPRLALTLGHAPQEAEPETLALLDRVAEQARKAGTEVVDFHLSAALTDAMAQLTHLSMMEARQALAWEYGEANSQLSAFLRERLDWGGSQAPEKLDAARRAMDDARAAFRVAMQGFDAVLTPAAPGEAPVGLHSTGEPTFNGLWTLLWGPNVTIPAGSGPKGLPLGVQLAGVAGDDARVMATARWLERVLA